MEKAAKSLTDYVIRKGMIDEADRETYEYGFTITIEVGLFVLFCLFMMLYLHMSAEGIWFLIVFAPLRSYAGGLHLEKFHSCFILSCLTFFGVLVAVKYLQIPIAYSLVSLLFLEILVYMLYPVENINRKVDSEEDRYFRKKLKMFLVIDFMMAILFVACKNSSFLMLETIVFCIVVITMVIGKSKKGK